MAFKTKKNVNTICPKVVKCKVIKINKVVKHEHFINLDYFKVIFIHLFNVWRSIEKCFKNLEHYGKRLQS